jgi:hypothetical protein
MKKVERVFRRTRSVLRTAEIVGIFEGSVLKNLRLRQFLLRYGPIRTAKCPPRNQAGASSSAGELLPFSD